MARFLVAAIAVALTAFALGQPSNAADSLASPPGDANCDRVTDSIDATLTLQLHARLLDALDCQVAADANDDGRIDSLDALFMLQHQEVPFKALAVQTPDAPADWESCLIQAADSSEFSGRVLVIPLLDKDSWERTWNRIVAQPFDGCSELGPTPPLPTDLNESPVVLLVYGFLSMGFRMHIDSIEPRGDGWTIHTTVSGCAVIPTISYGHAFLQVPTTSEHITMDETNRSCF
jgi:hypothetical protein